MPPSGRKGKPRGRKAPVAETREPSDAETPEAIATPTRSSRKRGRAIEVVPPVTARNTRRKTKDTRAVEREDTEGTEAQEPSDAETEPALPTEQEIVQHLRVADRQVNATEDFANDLLEGQENVPGYGKIAGRDWAFIIRKVEVNIGRPEAQEKLIAEENGHSSGPSARTIVDIDLGPDRQVSRSHAIISYDPENAQWFIVVNGRNGLRVDNNLLKRGMKMYLRNGSVIEIANTQMAFITTPANESDGPIWDVSIIKQAQKSSEEDDEGEEDGRTLNNRTNMTRQHPPPASRNQMPEPPAYAGDFAGQQYRTHPHSQRAMQVPPGTPMRPQQSFMKSSPAAANYARGVMMESTESIDYSSDNAKDLKPPHSYAQLIGMAILSTSEHQMTLNNIYKWIMANYAFYRFNTGGWQNSIRHNLSLNKAFTKIARRTDEPGKGMKWMIEPTEFDTFVQQGMKGCRRPQPLPPAMQSSLTSPNSPLHTGQAGHPRTKTEEETTPPLHPFHPSYPTATEAYTPDRGPRRPAHESRIGLGIHGDSLVDYDSLARTSTPHRNGMTAAANAAGSPPALYVTDEGRVGPLDTPFPLRPSQRFAPPSTLKRPSDFIQFSSPAPFWKMEGLVGSTPFRAYDLSPLKTPFSNLRRADQQLQHHPEALAAGGGGDTDPTSDDPDKDLEPSSEPPAPVDADTSPPFLRSSSPLRPGAASSLRPIDASPTLSRPATAVAKTLAALATSGKEAVGHELASESHGRGPGVTGSQRAERGEREVFGTPSVGRRAEAVLSPPQPLPALLAGYANGASAAPQQQHYSQPQQQQQYPHQQQQQHSQPPSMNGYYSNNNNNTSNGTHQPPPNAFYPNTHPQPHPHPHPHPPGSAPGSASAPTQPGYPAADDGEDEGIDLAKGFQPIGAFHQHNNRHLAMGVAGGGAPGFGR